MTRLERSIVQLRWLSRTRLAALPFLDSGMLADGSPESTQLVDAEAMVDKLDENTGYCRVSGRWTEVPR